MSRHSLQNFSKRWTVLWERQKPVHNRMSALEERCCCPTTPGLYWGELRLPSQAWGNHRGPAVPPMPGRECAAVPESTQCLTPPLCSGANPPAPQTSILDKTALGRRGLGRTTSVSPAPVSEPPARVQWGKELIFPFSFVPCCVPGSKASQVFPVCILCPSPNTHKSPCGVKVKSINSTSTKNTFAVV